MATLNFPSKTVSATTKIVGFENTNTNGEGTYTPQDIANAGSLATINSAGRVPALGGEFDGSAVTYKQLNNTAEATRLLSIQRENHTGVQPISSVQGLEYALDTLTSSKVTNGGGVSAIRALTQEEYDALGTPNSTTVYIIT